MGLDLRRRKPPVVAVDILDLGQAHLLILKTRPGADESAVQEMAEGLMQHLAPLVSGQEGMGYLALPHEIAVTYTRVGERHE